MEETIVGVAHSFGEGDNLNIAAASPSLIVTDTARVL